MCDGHDLLWLHDLGQMVCCLRRQLDLSIPHPHDRSQQAAKFTFSQHPSLRKGPARGIITNGGMIIYRIERRLGKYYVDQVILALTFLS